MRGVMATTPGGPETLKLESVPKPIPGPGEVLVNIAYSSVNRADVLQRMGKYPPPPVITHVLGLDAVGTVAETG
jgi:tumor protein p53-inducible protein 3